MGASRSGRASRERRSPAQTRPVRARRANPPRAPGRARGGRWRDQSRGSGQVVPEPQDNRGAPLARIPEARRPHAHRTVSARSAAPRDRLRPCPGCTRARSTAFPTAKSAASRCKSPSACSPTQTLARYWSRRPCEMLSTAPRWRSAPAEASTLPGPGAGTYSPRSQSRRKVTPCLAPVLSRAPAGKRGRGTSGRLLRPSMRLRGVNN